jgi:protein TonB
MEPAHVSQTVQTMYFPPSHPTSSLPAPVGHGTDPGRRPQFVAPQITVDVASPAIDLPGLVSNSTDFGPTSLIARGETNDGVARAGSDGPLRADQVERQVAVVPGSAPPRYPEVLRGSGVEGQVTAVFVVDESGHAEHESIRFLRSDDKLFEDAVKDALHRMRFIPAEVGGRKVRQLVQMPFVFTLSK